MIYVIGSGPSGVSISKSLLNQGLEVTILDVGLIFKKSKKKPTKNKFNRKLAYGSTFAYKEEGIKEFSSSYAKGGLSNVWGAAISPFTEDEISVNQFIKEVDSSSVMHNIPTCWADGFEYGLGAEVGISTDKIHARGPVGLEGLTSQKYIVSGNADLRGL